jgi:putative transposase
MTLNRLLLILLNGFERKNVQGALFSFTAHEFKKRINKENLSLLKSYFVNSTNREYQFWERESMVKECWTKKFFP